MRPGARDAAQVPGRADQRLGRHRHLGRLDRRRRRRRRRRPGGGGGGRLQPAEHPDSGARHRAAAGLHDAADGRRSATIPASSTSTPTSSRPSPSCASTSTAPARPTSASTSTRSPPTCGRWSAARRSREFKDGDDQFKVLLRLDEPYRNNPATMGDLLIPAGPGRTVKVSDVAALKNDCGPAVDRPLQPPAADFGERQPRAACRSAKCSRRRA